MLLFMWIKKCTKLTFLVEERRLYMLMRTNKDQDRVNHFSIRKLSIGAASVLLSTTLYFGLNIQGPTVHAAEANSTTQVQNQNGNKITDDATSKTANVNKQTPVENTSDQVTNSSTLSDKTAQQTAASLNKEQTTENVNDSKQSIQENNATTKAKISSQGTKKFRVLTAQATSDNQNQPSAEIVYDPGKDNVQSNGWFKVQVNSGNLINISQGETFQVSIGQGLGLNYSQSPISLKDFDVVNNGNGVFDLTAKSDFNSTNFQINASMSDPQAITADKTITVPVTITHNDQTIYQNNVSVNVTPAPQRPAEETHPDFYYKCFGPIAGTNRIAWGAYINYSAQELDDLDIGFTFKGDQKVVNDSINAYAPTGSELDNGIDATIYPDSAYSYDISHAIRVENSGDNNDLKITKADLGNNNLKQPVYVYFQTEVPGNTDEVQDSIKANPQKYSSDVTGNISGKTITFNPQSPSESGNGGNSDGDYTPEYEKQTKTITETINYLEQGTNKVLATPYNAAEPLTFTKTITKNSVTGAIVDEGTWSPDKQTFSSVTSPVIKGYTTETPIVEAKIVSATDDNIVINVYYTKNAPTSVTDSKTVKETINYLEQGTDKVLAPAYTTNLTFTRIGEKDAVTGNTTWGDWSEDQTFKAVTSPTVTGYTVETPVVDAQKVGYDHKDIIINVYYDKNEGQTGPSEITPVQELDMNTVSETIHYVYENGPQAGKTAAPDNVQKVEFTRVGTDKGDGLVWGDWNKDGFTFKDVDSPEIQDYVPDKTVVTGSKVTPTSKNIDVTVYYTLHTDTTGPSETTPVQELDMNTVSETIHYVYKNGPQAGKTAAPDNVQKVEFTRVGTDKGNGLVWGDWNKDSFTFKDVDSPEIKDYVPDKAVVTGSTVTPTSKDVDVTVYYTLHTDTTGPSETTPVQELDMNTVSETIHYVYENGPQAGQKAAKDNVQSIEFTRVGTDKGNGLVWGDWNKDSFTFKDVNSPEIQDYVPDKTVVTGSKVTPTSKNVDVTVYYTKKEQTTGPSLVEDDDVITETIKYVYTDSGEQAAPTYKDAVGFTREGTNDGKTTTWNTWNQKDATFKAITSLEIDGYTVSEKVVKAITVKPGDKNIEIVVYYTAIPVPTTPQPHPQVPDVPVPTEPVPEKPTKTTPDVPVPAEPVPEKPTETTPDVPQPHATVVSHPVEEKHQVKETVETPVKSEPKATLPQTGSQKDDLAIVGLGISMIASLLSLLGLKKKEN